MVRSRELHLLSYLEKYSPLNIQKEMSAAAAAAAAAAPSSGTHTETDALKRQIREWIALDNDMRRIKKELRQRSQDKEKMTAGLIESMKRRNIDVVNLGIDGQLRYENKTVKKPVTQKMLLNLLATYFEGDQEEAKKVGTFILDNREEVVKETLVRK
jgi:hypothetical protein